ncbi:Zn-dependent hydrolase [uncultured Cohaesibacter sp.]|uniref:Zn-dependent hydrolase n=1 Tax=uncultured Cohaesibacter sp. TaxID=1002546 RepID=UPI0029C6E29D|nr:Zn-dependent hydrolase [uncultured Cohaesibacter sp.]
MTEANTINLPPVDEVLMQADFDALAALTEPDRPWTRRSFTPMFLKGREYLRAAFEKEGLSVRLDEAGNLIGRWQGSDDAAPVLMTGSHSDTVPSGGRFDGITGVLSSLAAVRALKKAGYKPRHSIEIVDFLAEEPSEWGLSCVGSRGMVGALGTKEFSLIGPDGERLNDAIDRVGGNSSKLGKVLREDVAAFLEIHIEQGPVLEAKSIPIGIVSGIAGIARLKVSFEGTAAHAGTAPMTMREDAGLAMARFILAVRDAAKAVKERGHFTATAGIIRVLPGGANVVPGLSEIIIDIRAEQDGAMDEFLARAPRLAHEAATEEGCVVTDFDILSRTFAVPCDERLRAHIAAAAEDLALETMSLAPGAGHDAAFVARIAPAAMIFVPCVEGKSHCPEEWTETSEVAKAADILAKTLVRLDSDLGKRL